MDGHALADMEFVHQKLCRPVRQVLFIGGQIEQVCLYPDAWFAGPVQVNTVMKPNGLHNHTHFMVSILALSQYIQGQIDFAVCF
jgi:hypothetical protein